MADLYAVAGKRIYKGGIVSTKNADFVVSDFSAQTWTEGDDWETHGSIGDTAQTITTSLINRKRDVKQAGTVNGGTMENNFAINRADPGQISLRAVAGNGKNYAFKIEDVDGAIGTPVTVTMTIASPGVVSQVAHGKANGDKVTLTTTGALPTGLSADVEYYVVNKATDTYQLALTSGGAAINTTGSQSGVHSATPIGLPSTMYFIALVQSARETGGNANTVQMLSVTLEVNSNQPIAPAQVVV